MRYILLLLMCLGLASGGKAVTNAQLQAHFERLGVEVISMGNPIQVRPKMCYQKRAIEIYNLIKMLIYITAVFFVLLLLIRIILGQQVNMVQTILFLILGLGLIEVFPAVLTHLIGRDFTKEECKVIQYDYNVIKREFESNQKLKKALEERKAAEELERQKPTAESIWQQQRAVQNVEPN